MPQPFSPKGHPLTCRLLNQLLPGRVVLSFSLHFRGNNEAKMIAEVLLTTSDMEKLVELTEEYKLQVQDDPTGKEAVE